MKTCGKCKEVKHDSEFYRNARGYLESYCKPCKVVISRTRTKDAGANRKSANKYHYRKRYGLTPDEYATLTASPCEICGESKGQGTGKTCIDHSIDGSYHGVLCHGCNTAIGHFRHDPIIIERALAYVERTRAGTGESVPSNAGVDWRGSFEGRPAEDS